MHSEKWLDKDKAWLYVRLPKTMADNEIYGLNTMARHGYAPKAERVEAEVIRLNYIEPQVVTDSKLFLWHRPLVLHLMEQEKLRHGNLGLYSVIPHGNRPYLVDWAASRVACDPRPDKLSEGDEYWLTQTMEWYAEGNMI